MASDFYTQEISSSCTSIWIELGTNYIVHPVITQHRMYYTLYKEQFINLEFGIMISIWICYEWKDDNLTFIHTVQMYGAKNQSYNNKIDVEV